MSSEKKTGKDKTKKSKKRTRIDDLEPHKDDDAKGGATVSLATADTVVTADVTPFDHGLHADVRATGWRGDARGSPD